MGHGHDVLLDDGSRVRLRRHLMSGADELHAALLRKLIRHSVLEGGQEEPIDVDGRKGETIEEIASESWQREFDGHEACAHRACRSTTDRSDTTLPPDVKRNRDMAATIPAWSGSALRANFIAV
jgi:hypothetical protein